MFALYVTLQVRPEGRAEFLTAITENARASVRDEPGCLGFDVIEVNGADNRFAFYEVYADADAFHHGHKESPHFAAWREVAARVLVPGSQVNVFGSVVTAERDTAAAAAQR